MVDIDARFLGAVSTQGVLNITRPDYTVSWSRDNEVALITDGGGILVVDFIQTHEQVETQTSRFIGNETNIPIIRSKDKDLENYTGVSLSAVLKSKNKTEIFDIVRDSVLCPKELTNAEVHLYFMKVSWSSRPLKLKSTNEGKCQYILGALDSHFKLRMFIKNTNQNEDREGLLPEEDWKLCVDLTESYRNLLIQQFWRLNNVAVELALNNNRFDVYKERMYELATVDFIWLPPWENSSPYYPFNEGDMQTSLITAHATGDICIWNLCVSFESSQPKFYLTLEFRRKLVPEEIVRSLKFYKLNPSLGLLVIGTTEGSVYLFKITYYGEVAQALKSIGNELQPQKYFVDGGLRLWEKDLIEVQNTCAHTHLESDDAEVVCKVDLAVFKHPNFLLSFVLRVTQTDISIVKAYPAKRVGQGTVSGSVALEENNSLLILSERGVLSWIQVRDGTPEMVLTHDLTEEDNKRGKKAEQADGHLKMRLQFGGLNISPNGAMLSVSKTLAEYYDHLTLRTPSVLQFHSLFPTQNPWQFVQQKFVENQFYLHRMTDVLAGFREIMISADQIVEEILTWAVPLANKSLQDLQLLFWCLRVQPRMNRDDLALAFNLRKEHPRPFLALKLKQIRNLRRETLVLDHLMQLRCRVMVDKIVENPDKYELEGNLLNLQSLVIMYNFLETKTKLQEGRPLPLKPRLLVDPPPRKPACPLCGKATKLQKVAPARWKKNLEFSVDHEIDNEEFDGVLWHEQQHTQKSRTHPITNCIISLVPAAYPYRKCSFCATICMLTPAFGQDPLCPLCNGVMDPPAGFYTEDELDEGGEDYDVLIQQLEEQKLQESAAAESARPSSPVSRRAKLEALYI